MSTGPCSTPSDSTTCPACTHDVEFCGLRLAHPIINGSGTFDAIAARRAFGDALLERFPFSAFVSKTITLAPRAGNPPPRLWEAQAGMINSIGLPNRGLDGYLEHDLPQLAQLPVPLITNVMGSTEAEVAALVEAVDARPEIAAIELNVSCPNVKTGLDIGADPASLAALMRAVRPLTAKPLIVKLTPNTADVAAVAVAAEAAGADAVSLINTLRAMALDPLRGRRGWAGGPVGCRGRRFAAWRSRRFQRLRSGYACRSSGWAGSRMESMQTTSFRWEPRSLPSARRTSATRARGPHRRRAEIPAKCGIRFEWRERV